GPQAVHAVLLVEPALGGCLVALHAVGHGVGAALDGDVVAAVPLEEVGGRDLVLAELHDADDQAILSGHRADQVAGLAGVARLFVELQDIPVLQGPGGFVLLLHGPVRAGFADYSGVAHHPAVGVGVAGDV